MQLRDLPLSRKLFAGLIAVLLVLVPIYLVVHSDDDYDELKLKRVDRPTAQGSLRIVLQNDGGTAVRIVGIEPNGRPAPARSVRIGDDDGEDETRLIPFRRFVLGPLRKRVVTLSRPAPCLRELGVRFEIASGSQDRDLELPQPVAFPGGAGCS